MLPQDCERAIELAPGAHKPAYRRIQALKELGLLQVSARDGTLLRSERLCCKS